MRCQVKTRTTHTLGLVAAAGLLLGGCNSTSGTAGSSATVSSASPATGAGSSSTPATGAGSSSTSATSSAANADQLDAQSVAWFGTVCTGLTAIQQMKPPAAGQSLNAAGDTLVGTGETLTRTAQELQSQPAPTFSGADEFAPAAQDAFATVGGRLTELGQRAQALKPGDMAAGQQFMTDYQAFVQEMQQTLAPTLNLRRDVLRAVVDQVPGCQLLAGAAGG